MTIGEIIERAGVDTILGMAIVFLMLSIISFVIFLFRFAAGGTAAKDGNAGIKIRTAVSKKEDEKIEENEDDEREQMIAVIAAAAAAYAANHPDHDQHSYVARSARRRN